MPYEFLLTFNSNHIPILHRFWGTVKARYWSKVVDCNLPHFRWGWPCWNFAEIFGINKLEFLGYHMVWFAWSNSNDYYVTRGAGGVCLRVHQGLSDGRIHHSCAKYAVFDRQRRRICLAAKQSTWFVTFVVPWFMTISLKKIVAKSCP